jgi:hypothetical protein
MPPTSTHSGWTWTRDIASTRLLLHHKQEAMRLADHNVLYWGINQSKGYADREYKLVLF